jgi:prepilin-type N-terminal cleavage/methylation domain-containing protein/prepilin-type processing-associated H-X9-DG protein
VRSHSGFSLVELLVSIAILSGLAALVFPGLQNAREASRAAVCRDHLKQIGLSLSNHESVHRHFPTGAESRFNKKLSPTGMYGFSWWVHTLAYLEEDSMATQLDRTGAHIGYIQMNATNGMAADGFAPSVWFCPSSDVERMLKISDYRIAAPSYAGISGATSHDGFPESRVSRCCRSEGEISAGGVLVPNAYVRSEQVTDGLAKTLFVGEQSNFAYTSTGGRRRIGASFVNGWLTGTLARGVPPHYSDWLAPAYNLTTIRYAINENRYDLPGIYENIGANNPLLSAHNGVVMVLFCDGSVHALDASMEVSVLKSLATRDDAGLFD